MSIGIKGFCKSCDDGEIKGQKVICKYKYSKFGQGVDVSCVLMSPCHSEYRTGVILSCPDCGHKIKSKKGMVNCNNCEFKIDLDKIINERDE